MTVRRKTTIKPKLKPIKTIDIEIAIAKYFGVRQNIIVPNISWGLLTHEVDLLVVRKSGVAIEIEIKVSLQDFKADFNKRHHHQERLNRISEFYYAMPKELYLKCKDLIPENAGVITCERYLDYQKREKIQAWTEKKAVKIKNARKLTIDEQFKVAILGTMRIFNLKAKIVKLMNK
jgi:hypothetical protein